MTAHPVEIPADLARPLVALAWLLGRWEGVGVVGYPSMAGDERFGQRVEVTHDGRPFLSWHSQTWALDADGAIGRPLATETGYWRVPSGEAGESGTEVELLLSHPTGIVELYVGHAHAGRIELATDVVARSAHAKEYSAATRLYGRVEGDLLWAMDMAAVGHAMTPHASARLKQLPAGSASAETEQEER